MHRQAEACPQLEVILTDDRCDPVAVVNRMVAEATSVVLTTHLDSDDGLHVNALNRAQEHVDGFVSSRHERWLHNAPRGIRYDAGAGIAYRSQLANSPFHTLFERRPRGGSVLTAMSGNHSRLHQEYATHQDYALTGWLQVIHGGNLANRITGFDTETTAVDLEDSFGVVPPGRRSFYTEIPPLAG